MKLITVAALLFSTSAIAANQCKPDDVCLKFESNESTYTLHCKGIGRVEINDADSGDTFFTIFLKKEYNLYEYAKNNYKEDSVMSIFNKKFKLTIGQRVRRVLVIPITSSEIKESTDSLMSCVKSLSPIY